MRRKESEPSCPTSALLFDGAEAATFDVCEAKPVSLAPTFPQMAELAR